MGKFDLKWQWSIQHRQDVDVVFLVHDSGGRDMSL